MYRGMRTVFIGGMGHSGTTLMLKLLGLHSNIYSHHGSKENPLNIFSHRGAYIRYKNKYLKGEGIALMKNPSNVLYIDRLRKRFGNTRIILMYRDGRDVAISMFKRRLFPTFIECVRYWKRRMSIINLYRQYDDVFIISYEELMGDVKGKLREIQDFIGVINEDLEEKNIILSDRYVQKPRNESGKNHTQYRIWQINQPIQAKTRWKNEMTPKQLMIFNSIVGDLAGAGGGAGDGGEAL